MIVWFVVATAAVAALVFGLAALYFADVLTRSKRRRVQGTPSVFGLRYDDVQFRAPDLTVLRGWFLDCPGGRATVVILHDCEGTRADPEVGLLQLEREYLRHGYNVFAFDLRGRGESSGSRDRLGSAELSDLATAVAYVRRRKGELPVVLHGFGLGGALAIQSVANGLEVDCIISDSAFDSQREHLRYLHQHLPTPLFDAACWVARRVYRSDVDALQPIRAMARVAPTPVLLIHGEVDAEVPVARTLNLAAASLSDRNSVWIVPEVGHCDAFHDDPDLYLRHCLSFVEAAIPVRTMRIATAAAV
jgi:alpha-beta hydrolase superfamily lysophospholipase